ncbi:unnamed protein product, partial [Phaeothamnion confervicola]
MPKSKRNKEVHMTKAKAKGRTRKQGLIQEIREGVDKHECLYVFSFHNLRTSHMKDVRAEFRDSRFFLGKNKVMQLALGRSHADEHAENLSRASRHLRGHVGLLLTDRPRADVEKYFAALAVPDFASAGFIPAATEVLPRGILEGRPVSMLEQLRALGMVAEIEDGLITLRSPFCMCRAGEALTPEQAKALLHDKKLAVFRLRLVCFYSKGQYEALAGADDDSDG